MPIISCNDAKAEHLEGLVDEKSENSFVQTTGQSTFELLRFPSSASVAHLPKEPPTVQRAHTASLLALELRNKDDKNDVVWFSRIQAWVTKYASTNLTMGPTGKGPEYHATCELAPGLGQTSRLVQDAYDEAIRKVAPGSQQHVHPSPFDKEKRKFIRASPNVKGYPGVPVNIFYKPHATTVLPESRAVTQMNSRSEADSQTLTTGFFQRSNRFQARPVVFNFLQMFPGLARAFDAGEFTGEVLLLFEALKAVPYGWAFITGGTGSGKTTTAMSLVGAVISGSIKMAVPVKHVKTDGPDGSDVGDQDSNPSPADETANYGAETAAVFQTVESLSETPLPYSIIPTASGGNLECGLYALVNSIVSQLPREAPPSVDELRTILSSPEMLHDDHTEHSDHNEDRTVQGRYYQQACVKCVLSRNLNEIEPNLVLDGLEMCKL
ncbi:uncharacterized protein FTOL_03455 [Fusarium torulosum]|uniref:Uncharacterized protein n=1 Tax=Fusarium torulosum TaxID=33205 RepID=A0AAE8SFA7_9HYPO|nr:uncharacterized protein FTOL_03455 [Fusarium torulosum]